MSLMPTLQEYLDTHGVKYTIIHHSPAYTTQELAAMLHVAGKALAKTVIVRVDAQLAMVVLPASHHIDFARLGTALGGKQTALADEWEFAERCPTCELVAPPLDGRRFASPPVLHLTPAMFFVELVDHYLFALLHTLLYRSLMAENRRRLAHMETAIRRLEQQAAMQRMRWNALRQEEIIEEIEVIMLNTDTMQAPDTTE